MSEDGMEVDDLARAIRGLSGFKGHFTREVNNIIRLVPLAQACPTRALCEKLSEDLGRLETAYNRLAEHCTMLAQHDDDADRRRGYDATINQAEQNFGKWQTAALSIVSQFDANTQANNAVQQAAAEAPAGAGRPRAIEALRPEKLTRDHTLAELRSWEIKFRDFFETSFLGNAPIRQQQLLALLDYFSVFPIKDLTMAPLRTLAALLVCLGSASAFAPVTSSVSRQAVATPRYVV